MPSPIRPETWRSDVAEGLAKLRPKLTKYLRDNPLERDVLGEFDSIVTGLSTTEGPLPADLIEQITKFLEVKDVGISTSVPKFAAIASDLRNLVDEETTSLSLKISRLLHGRRPKFLLFGERERDLKSEYSISDLKEDLPPAVGNLARVAGLNIEDLIRFVEENDRGQIETIVQEANNRLKDVFGEYWSQSSLRVGISVSSDIVHILVKEEKTPFVKIAERSDGLRRFVALVSFLHLEKAEVPPILLIDELETHLHYDAQADLIQMLARQELASKVIYTTHSVGCLPEDLGTGVRMIDPGPDSSRIENWFWESDEPGFSPLLFGMGAQTLAFIPVRYSLIAEGAADMILLPSLFREVSSRSHLGFQIVPGLAEANEGAIIQLNNSAHRTAYLVDTDEAGHGLRERLTRTGIDVGNIHTYEDADGSANVLEDFVDEHLYVKAVNEELFRSYGPEHTVSTFDLGETNRPQVLAHWCKQRNLKVPSKRAVAYRVLDLRHDQRLVDSRKRKTLERLLARVYASFAN